MSARRSIDVHTHLLPPEVPRWAQKFGYGQVTAVEGNKLTVAFETAGEKKVIESFVSRA